MAKKIPTHRPMRVKRLPDGRETSAQRGYGYRWRKRSAYILRRDPICKRCGRARSEHADHIVAKRHGGSDLETNLQGLCAACHSRKTLTEDMKR